MIIDVFPFLAGLLSLTLAIAVLTHRTSSNVLRAPFALFAGSVAGWAILISLFRFSVDQTVASTVVPLYYIAALGIVYWLCLFSFRYADVVLSRSARIALAVPPLLVAGLVLVPGAVIGRISVTGEHYVQLESWYGVYVAYFVAYAGLALAILWSRAMKKPRRGIVLAAALTLCLAGGALFNLFLPWVGVYNYISLGPLFTFVMVGAVFYSIAKQGLFDLRWAAVRTAAYILTLGTLGAAYLGVIFLIFDGWLGQAAMINQTIVNVAITLVLALIFQPIKAFFDRFTHRVFYKDAYRADEFYARLNKELTSTTDLKTLLERASSLIAETLRAEQVHFFIYGDKTATSAGTPGYRHVPAKEFTHIERVSKGMTFIAFVKDSALRRLMISHRLAIIMPLDSARGRVGYLCLGDHRASQYVSRDMRVLQTIADELVIAIQNALSVQAVRELNAHLEQRIDAATKELRLSNAQLQKLDEAKDEFISMASHQLRTPLTSIKGYISMLMEGDVGKVTQEQKHLLQEAFISSERMVRLIGDFLNVSRLQTGKFIIDKHPVDLAALVRDEIDGLEPSAAARGLQFEYRQPKNIPLLHIDENKIQQVVMNFADNAIYYSKEGARIKISLKKTQTAVEFTVTDTGIGVPKEQQSQLFGKFFRASNARLQRPDGTGVGLFLAKKVIDAHGGEVIFTSAEHKGSTFGFRLPIDATSLKSSQVQRRAR